MQELKLEGNLYVKNSYFYYLLMVFDGVVFDMWRMVQVENVQLEKSGEVVVGTLHLTTHQMIFKYSNNKEELWVCETFALYNH